MPPLGRLSIEVGDRGERECRRKAFAGAGTDGEDDPTRRALGWVEDVEAHHVRERRDVGNLRLGWSRGAVAVTPVEGLRSEPEVGMDT